MPVYWLFTLSSVSYSSKIPCKNQITSMISANVDQELMQKAAIFTNMLNLAVKHKPLTKNTQTSFS